MYGDISALGVGDSSSQSQKTAVSPDLYCALSSSGGKNDLAKASPADQVSLCMFSLFVGMIIEKAGKWPELTSVMNWLMFTSCVLQKVVDVADRPPRSA